MEQIIKLGLLTSSIMLSPKVLLDTLNGIAKPPEKEKNRLNPLKKKSNRMNLLRRQRNKLNGPRIILKSFIGFLTL